MKSAFLGLRLLSVNQSGPLLLVIRIRIGNRGKKALRIRMQRVTIQLLGLTELYDFSAIHHGNPVANIFDHR
ncbi:hypothetical protein D3C71_2066220 [compost metagenome]